jgi:type I restriction enzyme S subunit
VTGNNGRHLPKGWNVKRIEEVAEVNPRLKKDSIPNDLHVSFVPMPAVGAGNGTIDVSRERPFSELRKGFTPFQEGDVLFAKITPCMENGKMAVVPKLKNGYGFGSTEFHVLRPKDGIDARYLYYYVSNNNFRAEAAHNMTGAVGQKRVPAAYLKDCEVPVAPADQQKRIVAEIEKQFSRLDEAVANLKRVKANLKRYKAAVLKAAVGGKLTENWRKAHPDVEPASVLLKRILAERRAKWKGKSKYKGNKAPDASDLPPLPDTWVWTTTGQLCDCIVPNRDKPKSFSGEIPWITLPDFEESSIDVSKARSGLGLTREEIERDRARLIPADSVVMSCVGRFGITGVCRTALVINQQLHAFLVPSGLNNRYFAYAIKTQVPYMDSIATATTIRYLNKDKCNSVPFPVPPEPEQYAIVEAIERIFSSTVRLHTDVEADLGRADSLRQSILRKAFSGKLVPYPIHAVDTEGQKTIARVKNL